MESKIAFPVDLTGFLLWVKTTTENVWSKVSSDKPFYNAKWLGLSDMQIDELERNYKIKFGYEHRAFLRILHTIDKPFIDEDNEDSDYNDEMPWPSFFYNWLTDVSWIESRLNWPYRTILEDIQGVNKFWLKSWGPHVDSDEEKIRIFSEWYNNAPKLLPIRAHTFLMDSTGLVGLSPLLSVWGSDTIVVAWNLRHFLMRVFADELHLSREVFEKEDNCYYSQMVTGIPELDDLETIAIADADIPYWKEVITFWTSGWQSFRDKI